MVMGLQRLMLALTLASAPAVLAQQLTFLQGAPGTSLFFEGDLNNRFTSVKAGVVSFPIPESLRAILNSPASYTINGVGHLRIAVHYNANFSSDVPFRLKFNIPDKDGIPYELSAPGVLRTKPDSLPVQRATTRAPQIKAATIILKDLDITEDGKPKVVTAQTDPPGLDVRVTYNGSESLPSSAGAYRVEAKVVSPGYTGETQGTLTIKESPSNVETILGTVALAGLCVVSLMWLSVRYTQRSAKSAHRPARSTPASVSPQPPPLVAPANRPVSPPVASGQAGSPTDTAVGGILKRLREETESIREALKFNTRSLKDEIQRLNDKVDAMKALEATRKADDSKYEGLKHRVAELEAFAARTAKQARAAEAIAESALAAASAPVASRVPVRPGPRSDASVETPAPAVRPASPAPKPPTPAAWLDAVNRIESADRESASAEAFVTRLRTVQANLANLESEVPVELVHLSYSSEGFEVHPTHAADLGEIRCKQCGNIQSWQLAVCAGEPDGQELRVFLAPGPILPVNFPGGYKALIDEYRSSRFRIGRVESPAFLELQEGGNSHYAVTAKIRWSE